jgi:hypothetical protein
MSCADLLPVLASRPVRRFGCRLIVCYPSKGQSAIKLWQTVRSAVEFSSFRVTGCRSIRTRRSPFSFACAARRVFSCWYSAFLETSPLRIWINAFGFHPAVRTCPETDKPHVVAVLSSTRLPGFTGRDLLTTTGSSATSHHIGRYLSCLLERPYLHLTLRLWES